MLQRFRLTNEMLNDGVSEKEVNEYLMNHALTKTINVNEFINIDNLKLTNENIVKICKFIDYFGLTNDFDKFITKIRNMIYDKEIDIEVLKEIPNAMFNEIYCNDCLQTGIMKCNYDDIYHKECLDYLIHKKNINTSIISIRYDKNLGQNVIDYLENYEHKSINKIIMDVPEDMFFFEYGICASKDINIFKYYIEKYYINSNKNMLSHQDDLIKCLLNEHSYYDLELFEYLFNNNILEYNNNNFESIIEYSNTDNIHFIKINTRFINYISIFKCKYDYTKLISELYAKSGLIEHSIPPTIT